MKLLCLVDRMDQLYVAWSTLRMAELDQWGRATFELTPDDWNNFLQRKMEMHCVILTLWLNYGSESHCKGAYGYFDSLHSRSVFSSTLQILGRTPDDANKWK